MITDEAETNTGFAYDFGGNCSTGFKDLEQGGIYTIEMPLDEQSECTFGGPANEEDLSKVRWLYFMPIWATISICTIAMAIYVAVLNRNRSQGFD